jgi:hypothetical protein
MTGVEVPFNLLLFLGCIAMLMMIMQLSAETGRLLQRTRVLAEELALLRSEVTSLRSGGPRERHTAPPRAELEAPHR